MMLDAGDETMSKPQKDMENTWREIGK